MTPTEQVDEVDKQRAETFDYRGRLMLAEAHKLADDIETLQHFKSAYSRALTFVCELHLAALPAKPTDDPFFASPDGNCCAVDVLIEEVKRLRK